MSDLATPITPSARNSGVAVLTAGQDRPYALGLASALIAQKIPFDFIASNFLDSPELRNNPLVRFLNLRGDQNADAPMMIKMQRVLIYYIRLMAYAATSQRKVFHILWNNKFEVFDRTLLLLYYKLCGKRLTFTAHNVNKNKRDNNDSWWNRFTLGIQYRLLDHIFVHTEQMRQELLTDFGVPSRKISVIPFGINSTVPNTALTPAEARSKLGLAPQEKTLLFFGHIAPYKGVEYLIEAVHQLAQSGENYRVMGDETGGRLEIKTSGRYTYEMGRALFASKHAGDQALWDDWYRFTRELAILGAFSADATEQKMARVFITDALEKSGRGAGVFANPTVTRAALESLAPSPEHMFWFEYNFLHVLAADGRAEKAALGDHTAAGYRQRARFYAISAEGRLNFAKNIAAYIVFLAENTGLASAAACAAARKLLADYASLDAMLNDIGR